MGAGFLSGTNGLSSGLGTRSKGLGPRPTARFKELALPVKNQIQIQKPGRFRRRQSLFPRHPMEKTGHMVRRYVLARQRECPRDELFDVVEVMLESW